MIKYNVTLGDKEARLYRIGIELRDGYKGKVLSICSQYGQGKFIPKNDAQQRLLDMWDKWHLNDMKAGTPKQNALVDKINPYSYEKAREVLATANLLIDNGHEYGKSWLIEQLPKDIEQQIESIIDDIKATSASEDDISMSADYLALDNKAVALFWFLVDQERTSPQDALEVCMGDYQQDYLVLDDEEADEAFDEWLDNYIDDCIINELPEQYRGYFDREAWKDDNGNDRGGALNQYNGEEYTSDCNGVTYYIYNQ